MNKLWFLLSLIFAALIFVSGCKNDDDIKPFVTTPFQLNTGDLSTPIIAEDNLLTNEGVALGRLLFYEKRLSGDNTQSCASCHRQEHAFNDTAKFSIGIHGLPGKRQAMSIFNLAWHGNQFFWDGRANLLRDQSLMPIQDALEMDETLENVVNKLKVDQQYKDAFKLAFGTEEVTAEKMSLAMEQFMNSIVSVNSKYDQFLAGLTTLSSAEERGRKLFFAEFNPGFPALSGADCAHCHSGKTFKNDLYINNGLDADASFTDIGREAVTGNTSDKAKFKVPTLRNIALTPPYMHDGRFTTLTEVVEHYNIGLTMSSTIDGALVYPLNSGGLMLDSSKVADVVSFLHTLTDYDLISNPDFSNPF